MRILTLAPGFRNKFLTPNSSPGLSAAFAGARLVRSPVGIRGRLNETTTAVEGSRRFTAQASMGRSPRDHHAGSRLLPEGFRGKEHGA